jgi:hypothetical protein
MPIKNLFEKLRDRLFRRWIACRIISDKKSVQYGCYFSYPIYILIVFVGILWVNPLVLSIAAVIAFLAINLPMHPLDYIYNHGVPKLIRSNRIPGRGSELQVNSIVALIFNIIVLMLITSGVSINYGVLGIMYLLSSIFFIGIFFIKD